MEGAGQIIRGNKRLVKRVIIGWVPGEGKRSRGLLCTDWDEEMILVDQRGQELRETGRNGRERQLSYVRNGVTNGILRV